MGSCSNSIQARRQPAAAPRNQPIVRLSHALTRPSIPLENEVELRFKQAAYVERMGGVQELIVDNADHDRCEDEVRMMHEQIIPQLPRLPGLDQAVHQVDQQDLQGDNKQAEAFRLIQGQRFFTSPHIRTERAACEVPC